MRIIPPLWLGLWRQAAIKEEPLQPAAPLDRYCRRPDQAPNSVLFLSGRSAPLQRLYASRGTQLLVQVHDGACHHTHWEGVHTPQINVCRHTDMLGDVFVY